MVPNVEAGGAYLQTTHEGPEETREADKEIEWESENGRASEARGRNKSESKEAIGSWRNLERDMVKHQAMWNGVMAAVTVTKGIRKGRRTCVANTDGPSGI